MNQSTAEAYPVAAWTWHDNKGGIFSTQIFSDGAMLQERRDTRDGTTGVQKIGAIPASDAAKLLAHCREALNATSIVPPSAPAEEVYELTVADSAEQKSSRHIARNAVASDSAMQNIRQEILAARKRVARRWNMWSSAGARWFYLTTAVTLALAIVMARDMKNDAILQTRARKTTATVIERGGSSHKDESLIVKLDGEGAMPEVKIFKYLSHPNWEASKPGAKVNVLYDAQSKQAWLAADLLRWQSDKKTIWVIPGFLLFSAFAGLAWLRRYEIGVYGDGDEYMIHQDRVVTDDKTAAISRSTLLYLKMFV